MSIFNHRFNIIVIKYNNKMDLCKDKIQEILLFQIKITKIILIYIQTYSSNNKNKFKYRWGKNNPKLSKKTKFSKVN